MPTTWKEELLKYKYSVIPEEVSYKKKKKKQKIKKADHKHQYEPCIFAKEWPTDGKKVGYHKGTYCPICGRIGDQNLFYTLTNAEDLDKFPVFWNVDFFAKYIDLPKEEEK